MWNILTEIGRWWLRLIVVVAAVSTWWQVANSDPQTNSLGPGCRSVQAKNESEFFKNLNAIFSDLRTQLSEDERFATAENEISSEPVYGMAQCRNYMSLLDCVACYDAAVKEIRINCSDDRAATSARAVFEGCFLRYEFYDFFDKSSENSLNCSSENAPQTTEFSAAGERLLSDLARATPKTKEYFAANKRGIAGNLAIYGVAQCVQTITKEGCRACLNVVYETIKRCSSANSGTAWDAACFMRYSNISFFADDHITDIKPFLENSNTKAIIGGVVGAVLISFILLWYKFSRQLRKALIGNILGATELQRPNRYSYKDLKAATNSFSEENKLGQGAFGIVYKATLENGTIVAVKKLDMSNRRAKEDFETEVRLISNVHHRNLVRLLGCCSKGSELLLVLEYMENGSLDRFLYGNRRGSLSWKQRFDIIFGTARGMAYLHEHYYATMIHRDIKPANILVDNEFQAKIADFGLAKLLPENQTHISSSGFAGTLGYTAPEYALGGHLSEKVDVYSFGVVILEIISGRRCTDMNIDSHSGYLLKKAWELYESDMHQNLADEALDSNGYEAQDVKKMVEIALTCTQSPPSSRPTMSQILSMLLKDLSSEQRAPPRRPNTALNQAATHPSSILTQTNKT